MSTGSLVMAFFIWSKELQYSIVHLILFPFLNMTVMSFTSSTKLETNLLRKLIFPKKEWTYFLDLGSAKVWMASTLLGSIFTPSADTMCPSNFPSFIANNDFLGFRERPYILHFWKTFLRWWQCSLSVLKKIWSLPESQEFIVCYEGGKITGAHSIN